jgi:hypothetical protein
VLDPDVDAKFDTYYRLLAKGDERLTEQERTTMIRLREELPPIRIVRLLGDTKREQLVYEAVDEYLAKTLVHKDAGESAALRQTLAGAREDVKRRIAEIWKGQEEAR